MKKLLIVEDNQIILKTLNDELKNYPNIEPLFAKSYKETMRILRENRDGFHAALLDLNLPDAPDGEVVLLANSHHIPVVVLTASSDSKIKESILKKDIIDYVVKSDKASIKYAINAVSRILKNYDATVLVVDDSIVYRKTIADSLKKVHLNVLEAKDGQEALEILEANKQISLVITDYEMPRLNGLELTFKIREESKKDQLGIIATSSASETDVITKFLRLGANDFINKPFSHIEIITRVNSNLELLELFSGIRDLANKDFLTGAYNRRYFFDAGTAIYEKAKRKKEPLAVAMIDIDKFKNINDTYGHDVGDVAIKEIKKILDANLRASDLMARFGGEEFCILLENITIEDTQLLFEKIRNSFEKNIINTHDLSISYTISAGIYYGLATSLQEMIRLSDEALYDSKENGRNRITIKSS
ncbi:MAG: diguanylate cyclase [Campylobacterales bacterium]|nr:diguanylate cyclase [Campylobacterales bacterium]